MTWGGVSVIVKAPRHMRDQTLVKEWDNLKARLPVQSDVASRLPIPTYYGLFNLEDCIVMVTSDNGISLDQLNKPIDDVRALCPCRLCVEGGGHSAHGSQPPKHRVGRQASDADRFC
ncbi:hypothetical protein K474DRAFT_881562 [Panus rudis PR-1116 ss-1]|nr:hypothetical protein K474DRAFT_881562 [Panus rudis PR-1116 ss-1]